jgi:hypothetical protein
MLILKCVLGQVHVETILIEQSPRLRQRLREQTQIPNLQEQLGLEILTGSSRHENREANLV